MHPNERMIGQSLPNSRGLRQDVTSKSSSATISNLLNTPICPRLSSSPNFKLRRKIALLKMSFLS